MKTTEIVLLSVTTIVCVTAIAITATLTSRKNEEPVEVTQESKVEQIASSDNSNVESQVESNTETTEESQDSSDVYVLKDGETFSDVIDRRASGEDRSDSVIEIPRASTSIPSYDPSNNHTVDQDAALVVASANLFDMPADYVPGTCVQTLNGYTIGSPEKEMRILYAIETVLTQIGCSSAEYVRAPMPYFYDCNDFYLFAFEDKVYTAVLKDDIIYLIDQGIPNNEEVSPY